MKKRIRYWLIKFLTKNLLKAITHEDVLVISGKDWLLSKRKLSRDEILALKDEAVSFEKSLLWKLIKREIGFLSNQQMFENAQTPDDIVFGKAMLYDLDVIRKFINRVKSL